MSILGDLSAEDFLAHYWQKEPLLVRGAVRDLPDLTGDRLAGLALEEDIESRLVFEDGEDGPWTMKSGPFAEAQLTTLPPSKWTLLVQAVDLWVPEVRMLLEGVDFLPPWRLDDIMVSFAAPGGSVGPHFDYYDVFLVQGEGSREWQVGQRCDGSTPLRDDTTLRILDDFEATQSWTLAPGDMLYLPPQVSHWGIATAPCVTYSIGFRAPMLAEMLGDLATELVAQDNATYYRDPPLTPAMARTRIDPAFIGQAKALLRQVLDNDELVADWFARYMTAPKYPAVDTEIPEERRASTHAGSYINGDREW